MRTGESGVETVPIPHQFLSLKQKSEAALLKIVEDAGLFTGQRQRSQEKGETTIERSYVSAMYLPAAGRPGASGGHTGQEMGTLVLVIWGPADKAAAAATEPEDDHASNVNKVRASVVIDENTETFAELLTRKATQPYSCLFARSVPPPEVKGGPERSFHDAFAWDIAHVEVDCTGLEVEFFATTDTDTGIVTLEWTTPAISYTATARYDVNRDGVLLATLTVDTNSWDDTTAQSGADYEYEVFFYPR